MKNRITTRSEEIKLRVKPQEKKQIKAAAIAADMTVSDWLRCIAMKAVSREP